MMSETPIKTKIRVLLADDHPVVRMGMRSYLSADDRVEIVGEAASGREAVDKARALMPDVVFMDTYMPGMTGLVAARLLGRHVPKAKVLMYSVHGGRNHVLQIIRSGARGFVLKDAPGDEVVEAIDLINRGGTYYNSEVAQVALSEYAQNATAGTPPPPALSILSERELEVLSKIAEGKSSRETAEDFGISVRTVETHREHIMRKLRIHTVAGLVRFALAYGVAPIE